ncbi:hypothetical protein Dimus_019441 [Dionaea muscipula]
MARRDFVMAYKDALKNNVRHDCLSEDQLVVVGNHGKIIGFNHQKPDDDDFKKDYISFAKVMRKLFMKKYKKGSKYPRQLCNLLHYLQNISNAKYLCPRFNMKHYRNLDFQRWIFTEDINTLHC